MKLFLFLRYPTYLLNDQEDARKKSKYLLPSLLAAALPHVGAGESSLNNAPKTTSKVVYKTVLHFSI